MAEDTKSAKYYNRLKILEDQQADWLPEWQDLRDHILPRSGMFNINNDKPYELGDNYFQLYDGTASRAARVLAAGMQGGLTSPSRPWFKLELEDTELNRNREVKLWLEECERRMYSRFARSNFYDSIHRLYQEQAVYGQAVVLIEKDPINLFRFNVLTAGEYLLAENERGIIDTMFRYTWMQAKSMKQKFGNGQLPREVQEALKNNDPFKWFKIMHCVQPRKFYDERRLGQLNMPFESVYFSTIGDAKVIMESGFEEQPFAAPRWMTYANSAYGRSPGHDVLGDVKMLQDMIVDLWAGMEKMVNPPLKSAGSMKDAIPHIAGGITYTDGSTVDSLKPIFELKLPLQEFMGLIQDVRLQIREGLYNDLFLMLMEPTPNMTATEVAERHEEKLLMLGPVIERQFYELLNPTIDRVFRMMYDAGEFPPVPQVIIDAAEGESGTQIKIEYISILARAQRLATTQSIRSLTEYALTVAQAKPDVLDKVNFDKAIDEFSESNGSPSTLIVPDSDVIDIRNERAKMIAARMQQEQKMRQAEMAKTMSDTSTGEGEEENALNKQIEGAQVV